MREFFKGWRRKTGCVTLLLAMVLTTFWVRSLGRPLLAQIGYGRFHLLHSTEGRIDWMSWIQPGSEPQVAMVVLSSVPAEDLAKILELIGADLRNSNVELREASIPYWSLAIPLTLLSAWLLLSKPRQPPKPLTRA